MVKLITCFVKKSTASQISLPTTSRSVWLHSSQADFYTTMLFAEARSEELKKFLTQELEPM
jgi:hypothetical protein